MFDLAHLLGALNFILGAVAFLAARGYLANRYLKIVGQAIAAAEKAVDKTAYNSDGTFNQARLAIAIMIIQKAFPHVDTTKIIADIEAVLAVVHSHVNDLPPTAIVKVAPVKK